MTIFEAYKGMYDCRHLPAFAQYLIDNKLKEFAREQVELSLKVQVPILTTLLTRYTNEELLELTTASAKEYLTYLASNSAHEQLVVSMDKWEKDQLQIVGQMDIVAQDITLINYTRGYNLKKFIPAYTSDTKLAIEISLEIDTIILGGNTTALDMYISLLKGKIAEQSNLATKVIEASPAVTFLIDSQNHRQLFVSGNVAEVLGYTPAEIRHQGDSFLFEHTHPDDLQPLISHLQEVIESNSNKTHQVEFRFRHKDGTYHWLRTYEVIFRRDEQGRPLELLGKTFEITHEKETALALEKSEKQLLEAQSIAHIGSYEWNIVENRSTNTAEVYRIFELESDQPYEEFLGYVHPDDVQRVKDAIAESFVTGFYECEFRYSKKNNEKVLWSIGKVEYRDNIPYKMVGTVQDITEIKKMEHELVEKTHELAQTNESLRQFAYVASHDMKEPLRKIMMFADLVLNAEKGKLSEKSIDQLLKMQNSGKNLYRMVEDILSFSLLDARETKQETALGDLISDVTELLDETINRKQAKIIYNKLPKALVVPSQFRQLFQNLISNSLKFSQANIPPVITITASKTTQPVLHPPVWSKTYVQIEVADNGIGFPKDASDKIFELFSRHHPKSQYEGTGLGLSIARRITDNHDGVIKAFPGNNGGASFIIVLPQPD